MASTNIVRSDDLRTENRRRVLDTLRLKGSCSPAELAQHTGLSAASISSLTSQMATQKIIRSTRQKLTGANVGRGRPQSLIELENTAGDIVTLNLAIDHVRVQRVDYAGQLLIDTQHQVSTRSMSEAQLLGFIKQVTNELVSTDSGTPLQYIGVGFQGNTENNTGVLAWSPIIQHQNVNLGAALKSMFNVPVQVHNDCRLISEALSLNHHSTLGDSFATLLFSNGVGLGMYIDGKPFSGIRSSALELGHLRFERNGALCRCGMKGCIEAYAADYGIERLANGQSIHDVATGRVDKKQIDQLAAGATAGEMAAIQAFAVAGAAVGEGINTLFTLLDPMPVALVGRSTQSFELMIQGINSAFRGLQNNNVVIEELLHCYDNAEQLLLAGLAHNTLALLDREFAYRVVAS